MGLIEILSRLPLRPGIGDPTVLGWLTVGAYAAAALFCMLSARQAGSLDTGRRRWYSRLSWGGLALAMLFLGVNKQLDLHAWLTAVVREVAWQRGWYALGQTMQVGLIAVLATGALLGILLAAWMLRRRWRQSWLLLLGVLFLSRFIVVRAATLYGVPLPRLSQFTGGVRINWALELAGAAAIALAALGNLAHDRKRSGQTPGNP